MKPLSGGHLKLFEQEIRTNTSGSVKDRIGRAIDTSKIGVMDPQSRMIGLHLYEGHFKVIPMDAKGHLKEAFNIRLEELEVLDIKFLTGFAKPTIAVLYQDQRHARHIKTYAVNVRDREFVAGPWAQCNVEHNASELIPVPEPYGGVLILGHQTICYHSGTAFITIPIENTRMCAYGWVDTDGSRLLISDHSGGLHVIILTPGTTRSTVETAHIEALGETSCASSISYLDNGVVFIGSAFGDSQLIKLNPERDTQGTYVEVLETYDNLGPITDMCVADLDRQGQGQAVTCSGCNKDGSLRIIRNGIGINEHAAIELAGIKGMWSLRPSNSHHDKYLVQAFISETRVLAIEEEEDGDHQLAEGEIAGFEPGCTLFCGCVSGDMAVQVTESVVVLISCETLEAIDRWDSPTDLNITVASGNSTRVVLALGGGNLVHLEVDVVAKKVSLPSLARYARYRSNGQLTGCNQQQCMRTDRRRKISSCFANSGAGSSARSVGHGTDLLMIPWGSVRVGLVPGNHADLRYVRLSVTSVILPFRSRHSSCLCVYHS